MISSINGNSTLQTFNALSAFRNNGNLNNGSLKGETPFELKSASGVNLNDDNDILSGFDISDIKNYATKIGEQNLTDEDIKYGITYGRSVIADYIA